MKSSTLKTEEMQQLLDTKKDNVHFEGENLSAT